MRYGEDLPGGQDEWFTYDYRMEQIIRLRSVAENVYFSRRERDEAYDEAGRFAPTEAEWSQARIVEEARHRLSSERKRMAGQRAPVALAPASRFEPPRPDPTAGVVSPARAHQLMAQVWEALRNGRPGQPERIVGEEG